MNGYVLAGGASRRMGSDKARLPHDGWTMAAHLVGLLEAVGAAGWLVRRAPDDLPWVLPDGRSIPVVFDPPGGSLHPLNGVVTALEHAGGDALITPCDLPGLTADALRELTGRPCVADGHPLLAHLPYDRVQRARELVATGGSARELVTGLPVVRLPAECLVDRNQGGGPWPIERLRTRLAWLPEQALHAVVRGERTRQVRRGILDPSAPPA